MCLSKSSSKAGGRGPRAAPTTPAWGAVQGLRMGPHGTSWGREWFSAFLPFLGPARPPEEEGLGAGEAGGVDVMSRVSPLEPLTTMVS